MKDSSHVNIQPLVLFEKGMLPVKIIKILIWFAVFLISIIGYAVIEENLTNYIVGIKIINFILLEVLHDGHSISKWGNLGKSVNTITDPLYQSTSLYKLLIKGYKMLSSRTNYTQTLGKNIVNKDGGKIAEKANANGNSLDTKLRFGLIKTDIRLLNSVRLNQVSNLNCVRSYSTDSNSNSYSNSNSQSILDRKKTLLAELTIKDFHEITNKVKAKQFELVRLAELKGLRSKEVQDFQILLAKSLDFRLHALDLLKNKKGSQTAGVDKMTLTYNDGETLYELNKFLRDTLKKPAQYKPQPIKRVWIPKPGETEQRPLGIPTIKDRAIQTLINLVLLPLVELTSEPNSYGFRPYRDCKMAIGAVKSNLLSADHENIKKGILAQGKKVQTVSSYVASKDKYILDADIKGFFENINHKWIIENVFLPAQFKLFIQGWLKAKIIDINDTIDPTSGTPQGGIISPTLANMTLNGLENVILNSIKTLTNNKDQFKRVKNGDGTYKRILIGVKYFRYADDFIVLARSKNIIIKYVQPAIEEFLKERGL
jgi:retron-type reverse transcriptase